MIAPRRGLAHAGVSGIVHDMTTRSFPITSAPSGPPAPARPTDRQALLRPPMYFGPVTGKAVDVTDEVLRRWAEEERAAGQ